MGCPVYLVVAGLGVLCRFLMSELGRLAGFFGMIESRDRVLLAGFMGADAALLCSGAMTFGRSLMVISGGCVCFSWHYRTPLYLWSRRAPVRTERGASYQLKPPPVRTASRSMWKILAWNTPLCM
jgi:hypothetical protein